MDPFLEIKKVPAVRAVGWRGRLSVWNIDTAFSRLYDRALESRYMFREPALGIRHGGPGFPASFDADYEVLFPLPEDPYGSVPPSEIREIPGATVAAFLHRGPYEWISCTYEKVVDWLRENRYVEAGAPREVFFVAPEPHSGGTQDDMLTEIQIPILLRSPGEMPGEIPGGRAEGRTRDPEPEGESGLPGREAA